MPERPQTERAAFDATAALDHLTKKDKTLARLVRRVGPYALQRQQTDDTFGALLESIVHQQLTGKAAGTILGRVKGLYVPGGLTPDALLKTEDERLRGAGLSRAKVAALRDLADRTARGDVPSLAALHRMEDDAIIDTLTEVKGIGRWTVEMLLIFRLGRPDVLPVDDFGVRNGFRIAFALKDMPTRAALEERGEAWRPFRSVASWYLWRAVDLHKADRIKAAPTKASATAPTKATSKTAKPKAVPSNAKRAR